MSVHGLSLGINGWRIQGQRTGVGRYVANIVRHWTPDVVSGRFDDIVFYTPAPARQSGVELPDGVRERVLASKAPLLVWENARFGPTAREDVLFCPSYSRPIVARGRTVVTIFEATLKLYPEYFPREHWYSMSRLYLGLYGWSGKRSALVLTTTDAARRDIVTGYGIPAGKIRVVRIAPPEVFQPIADAMRLAAIRRKYVGDDAPFFLFVGKITPRRNVPVLMEAFAAFRAAGPTPIRLLVIGRNTTGIDIAGHARTLALGDSFRHADYIPDDDLVLLYNAALAFVLPYSYEAGASLTTLEAQATGLPVITMDTPGLREATGDAALYLAEPSAAAIHAALREMAASADRRAEIAEGGLAFARQFTWKRTADETLGVLHEAARL